MVAEVKECEVSVGFDCSQNGAEQAPPPMFGMQFGFESQDTLAMMIVDINNLAIVEKIAHQTGDSHCCFNHGDLAIFGFVIMYSPLFVQGLCVIFGGSNGAHKSPHIFVVPSTSQKIYTIELGGHGD